MPRVLAGEELQTLAECRYLFPAETLSDLQTVRARYSDLRLYVDFYRFPNKEKKKLVYLAGTLPVVYEGSKYNIPVCIWLHETHPMSRPCCYVCPSVSMVINPSCPCVDASGNIRLNGLKNWTHGISTLSLLVSEMRRAFHVDTPLYAKCLVEAPPPAGVEASHPSSGVSLHHPSIFSSSSTHPSTHRASQWEQSGEVRVRRSYTEELLGIDFSVPAPSSSNHSNPFLNSSSGLPPDLLSNKMEALTLNPGGSPGQIVQAPVVQHWLGSEPEPARHQNNSFKSLNPEPAGAGSMEMAARLRPDQAAIFLSLMDMDGQNFSPSDVMEAVQLNKDLPSALRFLTHCCPICQEQVTFSKVVTMTHCSCFLCETCFKTFFSAAIKERGVDQLVCPQCGRPEVKGHGKLEEDMDYFNLLDTQIRHFLSPEDHELFQRKLRDRALQEMTNFCWCAHCSFGMLHEADQLRMECVSCKKSTCSQCRSAWSPEHQGLSCDQFRLWQQQLGPAPFSDTSIECPRCKCVFSLSRGGCLHFTCSQCQHQFCGGCTQTFSVGAVCGFSDNCVTKGLHAHHPRDCLYHLRDWTVSRLHLLLQFHRVSPSCLEPARGSGACLVLEMKDDRREEPCGKPAAPEHRGYCQSHYKERLVELINRCHADPVVLFSVEEMMSELQRWSVTVPTRNPDEAAQLFAQRLRVTLTTQLPLRRRR